MDLQSSLAVLKGLGPKSAEKFHRLGIYTIEDLLLYYPFRYEDFKAKSVLEEAKADGADFAKIAKDNTKGDKTEYSFDSGSTNLPSQVLSAALNLDKDGVSDVIKASDSTTYKPVYYIVKITKKTDKNADWKAYKKRLKEIIVSQKLNDSNFRNAVIGKAFKKANVKIKDKAFSEILSQYAAASGSGSSGSTTTTTAASSAATTAADDQTTAAE